MCGSTQDPESLFKGLGFTQGPFNRDLMVLILGIWGGGGMKGSRLGSRNWWNHGPSSLDRDAVSIGWAVSAQ